MLPNRRRSSRSSMGNSMREIGREIGLKDNELCPTHPAFPPRPSLVQAQNEPPNSILSTSKIPSSIPRLSRKPIAKPKVPTTSTTPCANQTQTPASRPQTGGSKTTGRLQFNMNLISRSSVQQRFGQTQPRQIVKVPYNIGAGAKAIAVRSVAKVPARNRSSSASRGVDSRPSLQRSRALSAESLCFTPFATPKSAFNFARRGGTGRPSFAAKSPGGYGGETLSQRQCKAPDSTNKKALLHLSQMVNEFLQDRDYPKKMTIEEFTKMTVTEYFNICKFILAILQYPVPTSATKPDDMIQVLIDASHVYKYSLTLTRSVLKTPTSPHSWPAALTFIAWLSNRADAATEDRFSERKAKNIDALSDDNFEVHIDRQLSDTYIRLFFLNLEGKCNVDEEEERFRSNLKEFCMIDNAEPIESIEKLKQEKLAELTALQAEEDPTKPLQSDIEKTQTEILACRKVTSELRDLIHKYQNLDNVESRRVLLESKIQSATSRLQEIIDVVEKQPISLEKKSDILKEIEDCSKQSQALTHVIDSMTAQLDRSNQTLENVKAGFYRSCEQLKIGDVFNGRLDKLESLKVLNGIPRIKRNPFDAAQLDGYLTEHTYLLNKTSLTLQQLKHHIFTQLRETATKIESLTSTIEDLERECTEAEENFKESEIKMKETQTELGNHLKGLEIKLKDGKNKHLELEGHVADMKKRIQTLIHRREEGQQKLDELKAAKKALDEQILNKWYEIQEMDDEADLEAVRATITAAIQYKAVYEKVVQQKRGKNGNKLQKDE